MRDQVKHFLYSNGGWVLLDVIVCGSRLSSIVSFIPIVVMENR